MKKSLLLSLVIALLFAGTVNAEELNTGDIAWVASAAALENSVGLNLPTIVG